MKTKVISIDPRLSYDFENLEETKVTTIRDKKIEVGTPVALWLKWRGQNKGYYCSYCFELVFLGHNLLTNCKYYDCNCGRHLISTLKKYPSLLKRSVINNCDKITLKYEKNCIFIDGFFADNIYLTIEPDKNSCIEFVRDEGFKTNSDWIKSMLKLDKRLLKGETVKKYLWRF